MKLPIRIIIFLWLVRQGKILSNQACVVRGITQDDRCKKCGNTESIDHIFRGCNQSKRVWNLLLTNVLSTAGEVDFSSWLDENLNKTDSNSVNSVPWNTTFAVTIWFLWKSRNELQFNGKEQSANQVALKCINFANSVNDAFNSNNLAGTHIEHNLIHWNFPPTGTMKINTDGSSFNQNPPFGSYGGLVRSDQGQWIEGYYGFIGAANSLEAELWGLRQALRLTKDEGWSGIIIESDCQVAVKLVNEEEEGENHPCHNLIEECKSLRREMQPLIKHVLREANRCADKMAKIGGSQHERLVKVLVPPMDLVVDLLADLEGISFPRGF